MIDIDCSSVSLFGVYDGHGPKGEHCSKLGKNVIREVFEERLSEGATKKIALHKAHLDAHRVLADTPSIDTNFSGTTSVVAVLDANLLTICHVGDSVAILGNRQSNIRESHFLVEPHDLSRADECARIERSGGLIMSTEEYHEMCSKKIPQNRRGLLARQKSWLPDCGSGLRRSLSHQSMRNLCTDSRRHSLFASTLDNSESEDNVSSPRNGLRRVMSTTSLDRSAPDSGSIRRIWSGTSLNKLPGCAFTRSLGDLVAHEIGVSAKPEIQQLNILDGDVIILASDGVSDCEFTSTH